MPIEERVSRLYLKNQAMLMEYIRALIHNAQDSEDVLQEVGMIILSRAKAPEADEIFPAWARGVARNAILHFWRTRQRARVIPDSRLVDLVDTAFEESDDVSELMAARRNALENCLKIVQGQSLSILRMRYQRGLTCESIAKIVKKTPGAVRVMLMRTRDSLARCIELRLLAEVQIQ